MGWHDKIYKSPLREVSAVMIIETKRRQHDGKIHQKEITGMEAGIAAQLPVIFY